ncbi:MAG: DUF1043 family protein [Cardiobacteriaceae bacterium]|nr:DUF1043 family protein [Cardiobacteriaceae bacterium]
MDKTTIIGAVIGFLAGGGLVWILGGRQNGEQWEEETAALRKECEALKKSFADYRNNVSNHFAKTADAVDQLTDSYKNVFNHLSEGAQSLMDKEALQLQLEKRQGKSVTLSYLVQAQETTDKENENKIDANKPAAGAVNTPAKSMPASKASDMEKPVASEAAKVNVGAPKVDAVKTESTSSNKQPLADKTADAPKPAAVVAAKTASANPSAAPAKSATSESGKTTSTAAVNTVKGATEPSKTTATATNKETEGGKAVDEGKTETPQEAVKRHIHNNQDKK